MTFEELFVAIDAEAHRRTLKPHTVRLLVHLIALAIKDGTQQIRASRTYLINSITMPRKKIDQATNELAHLMTIEARQGATRIYSIPPEWFIPQPKIFAVQAEEFSTIHSRPRCEPSTGIARSPLAKTAGSTTSQALGSQRAQSMQTGSAGSQVPIQTGSAGSQVPTENQQLTSPTNVFDSIESGFSSKEVSVQVIDRIARATSVAVENENDARELSELLRAYAQAFRGPHGRPDQLVLARCFAIAPLGDLKKLLLNDMRRTTLPPFNSYMYLVSVFAEKIHGIKNLMEKLKALQQTQLDYPNQLINYTMANKRKWA
jgi:hypothetical protein